MFELDFNSRAQNSEIADKLDVLTLALLNEERFVRDKKEIASAVCKLKDILSYSSLTFLENRASDRAKHRTTYIIDGDDARALNLVKGTIFDQIENLSLLHYARMKIADCEIPNGSGSYIPLRSVRMDVGDGNMRSLAQIYSMRKSAILNPKHDVGVDKPDVATAEDAVENYAVFVAKLPAFPSPWQCKQPS